MSEGHREKKLISVEFWCSLPYNRNLSILKFWCSLPYNRNLSILKFSEFLSSLQNSMPFISDIRCFFSHGKCHISDTLHVSIYLTKIDCSILRALVQAKKEE